MRVIKDSPYRQIVDHKVSGTDRDIEGACEAGIAQDLIERDRRRRPDIALQDIGLERRGGVRRKNRGRKGYRENE